MAPKRGYDAIGQMADGRAADGLMPPFDSAEGGLNGAQQEADRAEQDAVNAAASLAEPAEIAQALARAASAAEALGRRHAAASYRDAAVIVTTRGRLGIAESRASLGWDARGCALPAAERCPRAASKPSAAEPSS